MVSLPRQKWETPPGKGEKNEIPKHHKVLLENDHVRVLEVRVPPKEKTDMHWHPAFVVYQINGARVRTSSKDGKSRETDVVPGNVGWSDGGWHEAENLGSTEFHGIIVELKK